MARAADVRRLVDAAQAVQDEIAPVPAGYKVVDTGAIPLAQKGDVVEGVYEGPGPGRKVKKKMVPTFYVTRKEGGKVELLATDQLVRFFDGLKKGALIFIRHEGQIKAGAWGRVNRYTCGVK